MTNRRDNRRNPPQKSLGSPQEQWQNFIQQLGEDRSRTPGWYSTVEKSRFVKDNQGEIIIALPADTKLNQNYVHQLQSAVSKHPNYPFGSRKITFKLDDPVRIEVDNPLQQLNHGLFPTDNKGQEREAPVLELAARAESTCQPLYELLCQRTENLAEEIVTATFPWRMRVGGLQGFRERLLPVFHPVYGIPYVPSSSIKGALRGWARKQLADLEKRKIDGLLGYLNGNEASLGKVQILDAFPTGPCLSLDVATPQWKWEGDRVKYGAAPHVMLSMKGVTLKIGLARTSLGTSNDVRIVKEWLEQALLSTGLGSRVSAGYGKASQVNNLTSSENRTPNRKVYKSEHGFELWSQGIYGVNPQKREFRPVAVRGMLRYWFRAIALGLYSPAHCKDLEHKLFGTLEPKAVQGSITVEVRFKEDQTSLENGSIPHKIWGTIVLEAQQENHLTLIEHVLKLAIHVGGVGRGARRPLHWNDDRLRGCYWQPNKQDRLDCNKKIWQDFLKSLKQSFLDISKSDEGSWSADPGKPGTRYQDVLNTHAGIFLIPSATTKHPDQVKKWTQEGHESNVRGAALEFFYTSNPPYKGLNRQKQGNSFVGGELGTPSFVWIASNNLNITNQAYQVVTIFGTNHSSNPLPGRREFVEALKSDQAAIAVWPVN